MVKVCKCCSNIQIDVLKEAGIEDLEVGCIDYCGAHPEKVYGLIDNELIVCDSEDEFMRKVLGK